MKADNRNQEASVNAGADALSKMDEELKSKEEIAHRIDDINSERDSLFIKTSQLHTAIINLQNRVNGIPVDDKFNSRFRQSLNDELQAARIDFAQATATYKDLEDERSRLALELTSLTVSLGAAGLLEHRRRIEQAIIEVRNVQAAIEAQRQAISDADGAMPTAINRAHERQDMMADFALGKATESDLIALDDEIATERKAIQEAADKAAPLLKKAQLAQTALPGLERKLSAAQAQLQSIESKTCEVEQRFFFGEAASIAAEYVNHALHLKELYIRLAGLNSIISGLGGNEFMPHWNKTLHIPVFQLPQFEGLENPQAGQGAFFSAGKQIYPEQIAKAAEAEKSRIAALLGIQL